MINRLVNLVFILPVVALLVLVPETAHAYVDPGSGSVLVTAILGLFAAVGYTVRKQFYRIRRLFSSNGNADSDVVNDQGKE